MNSKNYGEINLKKQINNEKKHLQKPQIFNLNK
jgi:hypothetical protein